MHAHESQLKAYLRSSFPAVRDVEDVVQESYLRIWKAKMTRPIASAKAYLFQVARHLAIDAVRETKATPVDCLRDLSTVTVIEDRPTAADALCYQEKVSLVAAALTQLPARCRESFILRKFKQVPQRDIAAELGISERTVESQVTRGMKLIEAYLRKHGVNGFSRDEK
ncbi:MAG: RNA polymerase sigma factor [Opitutaceae bacterium]|nr:RNA polymerase sigma factor [Opitutaceae bacterium]